MDNDKIDQHSDEIEVESEEKERGKKIEIDEKTDSPPGRWQFMSISARMVKKSWNATQWRYCGQPLRRVCRWALRYWQKGYFKSNWKVCRAASCWRISVIPLVFIIVIMARQQLFTENTVTAVLPVMQKPTMSNVGLLIRLWGVVLLGNILGTGIAAWAFEYMPIFNEETRDAFVKIGMDVMKNTPSEMFANAIISGWLIATMVWMFPAAGAAKIVVIILMTWLIALGDTTHIVVGSVEILYLVFNGTLHWSDFIWPFALPTLSGEHLRRHLYLRVNESCTDS